MVKKCKVHLRQLLFHKLYLQYIYFQYISAQHFSDTYSDIKCPSWEFLHQKKLPNFGLGLGLNPYPMFCGFFFVPAKDRADWKQIGVGLFDWLIGFLRLFWAQLPGHGLLSITAIKRNMAATEGKAVNAGSGEEPQLQYS